VIGGERTGATFTRLLRHPTAGVDVGARGGTSSLAALGARPNRLKLMSRSGAWDPPGRDVTPTCVTCHKAHGNGKAFGLIYRSGTGLLTEDGDTDGGTLEHLCGQCHTESASVP